MEQINARKYALDILVDIEKNNAYSNIALNRNLKGKNIESIDRRLITELVYGVIENKIYLDFIIKNLSTIKMNKINVKVLNILRMGLYQIIYLDKIPTFAAVNESVKLAKKEDYRSSGFVNGILRSYLRSKQNIKIPGIEDDPVEHLSITYSHPKWMVEMWMNKFGQEFTQTLLRANNETPKLTIRTNTLKITKDKLMEGLMEEKMNVSHGKYVDEALLIGNIGNIEDMKAYRSGFFQVQDESSMLVAHVLDPKPGDVIMDICAAPGGKTTHIAQLMENNGRIFARDIYEHKLKLIEENASRLGITIIETEIFNAKEIDDKRIAKADRVLVDAPCSGLGIIRRKPELKYNKQPDDIEEITKLQLQILNNASKYVKDGGYLVYSTCTIEDKENIGVIQRFMDMNGDFEIVDVNESLPPSLKGREKYLQLYPNSHGTDGFFICKLRKK